MEEHITEFGQLKKLYEAHVDLYEGVTERMERSNTAAVAARGAGIGIGAVGTIVSISGFIVGAALAPVTLGGSLLLSSALAIGGGVGAIAGGFVSAGSAVGHGFKQYFCMKELKDSQTALFCAAKRGEDALKGIMEKASVLKEEDPSLSDGEALRFVIYCIKRGVVFDSTERRALIMRLKERDERERTNGKFGRRAKIGITIGALQGTTDVCVVGVLLGSLAMADELAQLLLKNGMKLAPVTLRAAAAAAGAGFGVLFLALDIYGIVKTVKSNKEFISKLRECINQYKQLIEVCDNLLGLFEVISVEDDEELGPQFELPLF